MNQKQLLYFLTTAGSKSIAAAARELDIAQPAMSQAISKLEHELGTQLFIRGPKGVYLTESGKILFDYALKVTNDYSRLVMDIEELERRPKGTVVLAMNQATDNILALPLTRAVEANYPDLDLDLRTGLSYEVIDMLKKGIADVAIIYEDGLDVPDINKELIIQEAMYFVSEPLESKHRNKASDISFTELSEFEVVTTSGKESLAYLLSGIEKETGIKLNKRRPYGQLMTSLRFACEGHCRLVLPSSAFYHLESKEMLFAQKIIEPEIYRSVFIATDQTRPVRNISLILMNLIKQCTYQEYKSGRWRGICNLEMHNER